VKSSNYEVRNRSERWWWSGLEHQRRAQDRARKRRIGAALRPSARLEGLG